MIWTIRLLCFCLPKTCLLLSKISTLAQAFGFIHFIQYFSLKYNYLKKTKIKFSLKWVKLIKNGIEDGPISIKDHRKINFKIIPSSDRELMGHSSIYFICYSNGPSVKDDPVKLWNVWLNIERSWLLKTLLWTTVETAIFIRVDEPENFFINDVLAAFSLKIT